MMYRWSLFYYVVILWPVILGGCVERRITVTSDPPGAKMLLDGKQIGETPVSTTFDFYGSREITLYKKGYITLSSQENIRPPWYEIFPLDFFFDCVWPFRIQDEHALDYTLKPHWPLAPREKQELENRGMQFKEKVNR